MPNLLIAILLAVLVGCIAILQIFGPESWSRDKTGSFLSRLTTFGWIRVALAMIAFVLVSLNAYMGHQSDKEFSKTRKALQELEITNEALEARNEAIDGRFRKIQTHRSSIIRLVEEVIDLRLQNNVLERVLGEVEFVPIAQFTIQFPELDYERQHDISTIIDKQVNMNKGDTIDWKIDCESPLTETMKLNAVTGNCSLDGFGTFQAYAHRLTMSKPAGRKILEGTRSNDGQFLFRTACRGIHIALKQGQCKANVSILTPTMVRVFDERKKRGSEVEALDLSPVALRACRTYELLSDKPRSEGNCRREIRNLLLNRVLD